MTLAPGLPLLLLEPSSSETVDTCWAYNVKLDPGPSDAAMLRTLVENVRIVD